MLHPLYCATQPSLMTYFQSLHRKILQRPFPLIPLVDTRNKPLPQALLFGLVITRLHVKMHVNHLLPIRPCDDGALLVLEDTLRPSPASPADAQTASAPPQPSAPA